MYTKEEREGILWELHRSGLGAQSACDRLSLFPGADVLYDWLYMEERGSWRRPSWPTRKGKT